MESEALIPEDAAAEIARLRQELREARELLERSKSPLAEHEAQAALAASERRFRDISEATSEFMWEVDCTGLYSYANHACRALLGYAPEELVGHLHFYDLYPSAGRDEFRRQAFEVFARKGAFIGLESQAVTKDGRVVERRTNGVPILDANGVVIGYRGSDQDITERRHAEAAVARDAERRRVLFEQSRDGIVVLDWNGKVYEANRRYAEMLGYTPEELRELHVWDWDTRWTREQLLEQIRVLGKGGDHFETRHRRKDGSFYDVEISTSATYWDGEKLVLCICRDVSQRRCFDALLRARLRLSEMAKRGTLQALVRFAVDSAEMLTASSVGFFHFLDPEEQCVALQTWSTNTLATGCHTEGAGQHYPLQQAGVWTDCVHRREPVIHNDYPSLPHKKGLPPGHVPLSRELTVPVLRDDRVVAILGVGNKQVDYSQDDVAVVMELASMLMDLVARKQAEESQHQLELQLLHAQKLESLGVLAGGIAHDFNNILAGIRGYADLVLTELPPGTPAYQRVEEICTATRRAADLTRQILTYAGKGHFHPEPLDLSQVVEDMRRMLEVAVSKKATLSFNLAADLPATQADVSQIRQVLMNLVANAAEALGESPGLVSITTCALRLENDLPVASMFGNRLPQGEYVVMEVADTGVGMDEATQRKVFDPFYSTKFAGRGLGLATVQGIVRTHQGAVLVSSRLGEGSTFRVLLPAGGRLPVPASNVSTKARCGTGSGTVLVVDDEETVRSSTRALFMANGFGVLTAGDGEQALDIFRQHHERIVCVLLDLTMPKMSGEEVLAQLRRIAPDIPVILTSGYTEEETMRRVAGQRVFGFVQKPDPLDGVIARLQQAVAQARAAPRA
jgi:PAS domain S-box-containing protein